MEWSVLEQIGACWRIVNKPNVLWAI